MPDPIFCGFLTFQWSDVVGGYCADIGPHQVQVTRTEANRGHWQAALVLDAPLEGHTPEEVIQQVEGLLDDLYAMIAPG